MIRGQPLVELQIASCCVLVQRAHCAKAIELSSESLHGTRNPPAFLQGWLGPRYRAAQSWCLLPLCTCIPSAASQGELAQRQHVRDCFRFQVNLRWFPELLLGRLHKYTKVKVFRCYMVVVELRKDVSSEHTLHLWE
jgi:hypothetical protein